MLAIDFEGTNIEFVKPSNMTDEQCSAIRAYIGRDSTDGFDFILLAFQPNKEDLEAFNAGRPLMMKIWGCAMPPLLPFTYDENFNPNL